MHFKQSLFCLTALAPAKGNVRIVAAQHASVHATESETGASMGSGRMDKIQKPE